MDNVALSRFYASAKTPSRIAKAHQVLDGLSRALGTSSTWISTLLAMPLDFDSHIVSSAMKEKAGPKAGLLIVDMNTDAEFGA